MMMPDMRFIIHNFVQELYALPRESQPRNGHIGDEATRQVDYRDPTVVYSGVYIFMKTIASVPYLILL